MAGFALKQVVACEFLTGAGEAPIKAIHTSLCIAAAVAVAVAVAVATMICAGRALRKAPRLGGKGIATVALVAAILLGLAPVLLLVAIVIGGGV